MSKSNKKLVNGRRWPGVLCYESTKKKISGRPDICYYIRYTLPDRYKRLEKVGWKSEGYTPQVAAEIRADRIRKARHGEEVKTARQIAAEKRRRDRTLGEIAQAYFESKGDKLKGRKTDLNRYELHIQPLFGKRPISSLAPLDVDRVKANMRDHAPATVSNTLELLRRLVNFGIDKGLCSPLSFKIKVPKKNNEVTEYLKPEEVERLVKVLEFWPSQDVARMLKLAILSGIRRGEIFKLEDRDLDFTQRLIILRGPKGGPTVSVPMSEPAKELFEIQIVWRNEKFPNSSFVFPGKGGRMRVDCSAVDRIKEKAALPKEFRIFHGLRHHFAVMLANSGEFSLDMIGELLTHKSAAMTKRYSKFLPGTMKRASNRAAEILLNQAKPYGSEEALTTESHTKRREAEG